MERGRVRKQSSSTKGIRNHRYCGLFNFLPHRVNHKDERAMSPGVGELARNPTLHGSLVRGPSHPRVGPIAARNPHYCLRETCRCLDRLVVRECLKTLTNGHIDSPKRCSQRKSTKAQYSSTAKGRSLLFVLLIFIVPSQIKFPRMNALLILMYRQVHKNTRIVLRQNTDARCALIYAKV